MYRLIRECGMPKWLKILIDIVLTITIIYWLGYMLYKFLSVVRFVLHTITEKEHWWFFVVVVLGVLITILFILEFKSDTKPFTSFGKWIISLFDNAKNNVGEALKS